ncbi:uncharacterized protein NPIL_615911 [Nephila pilipes]|uniref:MD-2-related lipid-recognition domain-containing protein n=1 Tax=Nephila pilipes TaxID=299642 RepID=A0A8X6P009_NEPPI|nr:uncharacterized protein NPIL_615911 [Nephila pilipes]
MDKALCRVLLLLLVQFVLRSEAFQECDGIENGITDFSVEVLDCEYIQLCVVPVGTTLYIKTTFVPQQNLKELKGRVSSKMGVLLVPKGPSRFVCANSISKEAGHCDKTEGLIQGRTYVYIEEFPIRSQYRELQMMIRVELYTGYRPSNNNTILCYEIPLLVTSES